MGPGRGLDITELTSDSPFWGEGSLGSSRSAGLDPGIGLSVGDHIVSIQMEPLLRVKEVAIINYARTTDIAKIMTVNLDLGHSSSVPMTQRPLVVGQASHRLKTQPAPSPHQAQAQAQGWPPRIQ